LLFCQFFNVLRFKVIATKNEPKRRREKENPDFLKKSGRRNEDFDYFYAAFSGVIRERRGA
jgi:hypothetical protein